MDSHRVNQTAKVRKQSPSCLTPNASSGIPKPPWCSVTITYRTNEDCYIHGYVYYGKGIQIKSSQGKKHIVQNGVVVVGRDGFKNKISIVSSLCLWNHDTLLSWHHVAISTEYCQPRNIRKAHPSFGASVFLGFHFADLIDWLIDWLPTSLTSVSRPTAPTVYHRLQPWIRLAPL